MIARTFVRRLPVEFLLRVKPVLRARMPFQDVIVMSRHADIVDVLERPRQFSVAHYGVRLSATTGSFLLGIADDSEYRRDLGLLRSVVSPGDAAKIRALIAKTMATLLDQATTYKDTVDVVGEIYDPLALRYIEDYFGLPDVGHGQLLRAGSGWRPSTSSESI